MGFHTFDPDMYERLEDPTRFRFCSREELLQHLPRSGTVLDHGSGTGFYTDELAASLDRIVAFDLQPAMHARYGERGVPGNVHRATGDASSLPFGEAAFAGAVSTMTFHEVASEGAVSELARVLEPGGTAVIVDWSNDGDGASGPPVEERYTVIEAVELLTANGFTVRIAAERTETFLIVAERPAGE